MRNFKVIDSFIFEGELEILSLRLDYLYDSVDFFIFVDITNESTKSYITNEKMFENYKDKIYYINLLSIDDEVILDSISKKIDDIATEDTLILFSKHHEIPDKQTLQQLWDGLKNVETISFLHKKYSLSILNPVDDNYEGTKAMRFDSTKKTSLYDIISNKLAGKSNIKGGFCLDSLTSDLINEEINKKSEIDSDLPIEFYRHGVIFKNTFNRVKLHEGVIKRKINAMQIPLEIEGLQLYVERIKPKIIVEIGSATGGTLARWFEIPSAEIIISIDLTNGIHGGQDIKERYDVVKDFFKQAYNTKKEFHPIDGNSKDEKIIAELEEILDGRKVDFLFIDGDHTFEGVKADFDNYKRFVSENSLIGFHDIINSKFHIDCNCHVYDLWVTLKNEYYSKEFIHTNLLDPIVLPYFGSSIPDGGFAGIGLIDIHKPIDQRISLIVPVYSNIETTIRSINTTLSCSSSIKEVIIFSNGSTNEENMKLIEAFLNNPIVKIKTTNRPIGFIKAANELMKMAKFENILCMNSDAHLGLGWEDRLLPMLLNHRYGIVGPIMVRDFILGCCFIVKKSNLNKLGMLNEGFGMGYVDDVEFSDRVVRNGLELGHATYKPNFDNITFVDFPIVHTQGESFKLLQNVNSHDLNERNKLKYGKFKDAEIIYVIHNWNAEDTRSLISAKTDDVIVSIMNSGEEFEKLRFYEDITEKIHLFECTNDMNIDTITESILKNKKYVKLDSVLDIRKKSKQQRQITWLAKFDDHSSMGILSQRILEKLDAVDFVCHKIIGETETTNKLILQSFTESKKDIGIMFSYPDMHSHLNEFNIKVIYTGADTTGGIPNFTQNINNADYVLTPSVSSKKMMEKLGVKPPIFVFPHGIDPELFTFKERKVLDKFKFLYVGECSDRKGIFQLLEAFLSLFKNNQNVELHIKSNSSMLFYGSEKLIKIKQDNSNIFLHFGNEGHDKVVDLYNECHAYVYPSRADTFGMTLLEAMACGLPIISTDIPGATELIENRYYSVKHKLVPVESHPWMLGEWGEPDTFSLTLQMREIYTNYSNIISEGKLKENSDFVRKKYSWTSVVRKFEAEILPRLVKKKKVITLMTSFNRPGYLRNTLESITKVKEDDIINEIYLVENSDIENKETVKNILSEFTDVVIRLYDSDTNLGQRGSLLQMLDDININDYDYLQLTDQDNIFHEPISTYLDILDEMKDIWFVTGYMSKEHQELGWRKSKWGNLCEKRTLRAGHLVMRISDLKNLLPIRIDGQYGQPHNSSWHAGLDWELSYWNKNAPARITDKNFVLCVPGGVEHVGFESTMYNWDVKGNEYDLQSLISLRSYKKKSL